MNTTTVTAAAIYCRISSDGAGHEHGVQRQEVECRQLAEQLGWAVAEVFTDNDISAYSGRTRPAYQRLLGAIKTGEIDGLLIWHNDRLHRNPGELEDFILLVDATKLPISTVTAGVYDLTTASARLTARIVGAVARGESEHKAERLRSKHAELRAKGAPAGGRLFGLSEVLRRADGSGYRELVPDQAELLQTAARDILAGMPILQAAQKIRVHYPTMSTSSLRRCLQTEAVAGLRDGKQARWPAIIDIDSYNRLRHLFAARKVTTRPPTTLLGGLLTCKLCNHTMGSAGPRNGYRCNGCGNVSIVAGHLEADIALRVLARLDGSQVPVEEDDSATADAEAELSRLEAKKIQHAEMHATGDFDLAEFRAAKAINEAQIAEQVRIVSADVERTARRKAQAEALGLKESWGSLGVQDKRRVISALTERIVVGPGVRGRKAYDPTRVTIDPR
jgi:site-specific DNA recombinase